MTIERKTLPTNITCAKCGTPVVWVELAPGTDQWWLHMPCDCGSRLFNIKIEKPMMHCQLYGVGVPE